MNQNNTAYNRILANYFISKPLYLDRFTQKRTSKRKLKELPWQLIILENYEELKNQFKDFNFLLELMLLNIYEFMSYWRSLESNINNIGEEFLAISDDWEKSQTSKQRLELMFNELSHGFKLSENNKVSKQLIKKSLEIASEIYSPKDIELAVRRNNYAVTIINENISEALELFHKVMPAFKEYFGRDGANTIAIYENIAVCYQKQHKFKDALRLQRNNLKYIEQLYGSMHYLTLNSKSNLAYTSSCMGKTKQSLKLYREVVYGFEETFGVNNSRTVLEKSIFEKHLDYISKNPICKKHNLTINGLIEKLYKDAQKNESKRLFETALEIYSEIEEHGFQVADKYAMAICLFGKARCLSQLSRKKEAISEAKMALNFAENLDNNLSEEIRDFSKNLR